MIKKARRYLMSPPARRGGGVTQRCAAPVPCHAATLSAGKQSDISCSAHPGNEWGMSEGKKGGREEEVEGSEGWDKEARE